MSHVCEKHDTADLNKGKPPDLSLFQLALVWLQNSGACNLWLCAILVLLQRLVQLLGFHELLLPSIVSVAAHEALDSLAHANGSHS